MTLKITHRLSVSCPRHPRYNPENGGNGAIKAGCEICTQMFRLWRGSMALDQEYYELAEKIVEARRSAKAAS